MTDCNFYTVQRGDTLSQIAQWFGVAVRDLIQINDIDNPDLIRVGDVLRLTPPDSYDICRVYTVRSGDTLSEIGERYRVNWQGLAHYNAISNPDLIFPGQVLCIPGSSY